MVCNAPRHIEDRTRFQVSLLIARFLPLSISNHHSSCVRLKDRAWGESGMRSSHSAIAVSRAVAKPVSVGKGSSRTATDLDFSALPLSPTRR